MRAFAFWTPRQGSRRAFVALVVLLFFAVASVPGEAAYLAKPDPQVHLLSGAILMRYDVSGASAVPDGTYADVGALEMVLQEDCPSAPSYCFDMVIVGAVAVVYCAGVLPFGGNGFIEPTVHPVHTFPIPGCGPTVIPRDLPTVCNVDMVLSASHGGFGISGAGDGGGVCTHNGL